MSALDAQPCIATPTCIEIDQHCNGFKSSDPCIIRKNEKGAMLCNASRDGFLNKVKVEELVSGSWKSSNDSGGGGVLHGSGTRVSEFLTNFKRPHDSKISPHKMSLHAVAVETS